MKLPRMTLTTLGVDDLERSARFYQEIFSVPLNRAYEGVVFIELPGVWLALYPLEKLAEDISPDLPSRRSGFSGITLAYNARSQEEVVAIFATAAAAGAAIVKSPQDTFWGGFSGYFSDPDGYYWEVAWGPMFDFASDGSLRFKK